MRGHLPTDAEAEEHWQAFKQVAKDLGPEDGPMIVNPEGEPFDAWATHSEADRISRQSEYPHDFRSGIRDEVIAKHTDANGDVIDPQTGAVIPPEEVTVEHKNPVAAHWNNVGRFSTREVRNDFYNDKNNLTVMPKAQNSAEGAERQNDGLKFIQEIGPGYTAKANGEVAIYR